MIKTIFGAVVRYFRKLDKGLFIAVCGLSALSVLMMYTLVTNGVTSKETRMYKIQFIASCMGAAIALIIYFCSLKLPHCVCFIHSKITSFDLTCYQFKSKNADAKHDKHNADRTVERLRLCLVCENSGDPCP